MSTPLLSHNNDSSTSSLKLQSTQEFIQFLQEVQVPSSSTMQRWQTAGSVTVPMDWQTFCDIKKLLNEECGYAYRKGTLTLEPPRERFSAQQSVSSAWSLKASILAHLVEQLSPYSKNGTSSGLGIVVHQNAGYALAGGSVFRTADLHISVSAAHNLDVRYDTLSATGASLVVGVVTQADQLPEAVEGVDEWFAGNRDVMQVLMVYCDAARVARCQAQGKARGQHTDNEQVGAVWRWGRDTRGGKILLKEIKITYHHGGYTDIPVTLVDFARELGVPVPRGERLVVVFDWNHALSAVNVEHRRTKEHSRKAGL